MNYKCSMVVETSSKKRFYPSFICNDLNEFPILALRNNPTANKITLSHDYWEDEVSFSACDGMQSQWEKIHGKWYSVPCPFSSLEAYYEFTPDDLFKLVPAPFLDKVISRPKKKQFFA